MAHLIYSFCLFVEITTGFWLKVCSLLLLFAYLLFMYHYITLWSMKIYMTWMWILAFIIIFLLIVSIKGKKYRLNTYSFRKYMPFYLLGTYLLSTYTYYVIEQHIIFPLSIKQILLYLSPYEYHFHLVGIILWLFFSWVHFLKTIETPEKKQKRLHIFLSATIASSIPLWVFLLLWDNFIWLPTQSSFYISAIRSDSHMAIYGKVIPLGFFFSLWFLIWWIWYLYYKKRTNKNIAYLGFSIMSLFLAFLFLYQQYPKHFVLDMGIFTLDIKQYLLIFMSLWFLRKYFQEMKNKEKREQEEETETLKVEEIQEIGNQNDEELSQ